MRQASTCDSLTNLNLNNEVVESKHQTSSKKPLCLPHAKRNQLL